MVLTPLFLDIWPLPVESAQALRSALAGTEAVGQVPSFADFLLSVVPTNPVTAAAEDAILPLILFTVVFAFAMTRLPAEPRRSEEHTSELQSLMRISYAVFCLKKKTHQKSNIQIK